MTVSDDDFLAFIERAFREEPIPTRFFWAACESSMDEDIPRELASRIAKHSWKDLTITDWRMIGASPAIARFYIEPAAFLYYLPSLLLGAFGNVEHVDYALESIIPNNKNRLPRGKWWIEFSELVSELQRAALSMFLSRVQLVLWDQIGSANQELVRAAQRTWPETAPGSR